MKNFIFLLAGILLFSTSVVSPALAVEDPNFPACPNPGGNVLASYPDGVHGIPGDQNTYTGSDTVYSVNSNQLVQCFCANSGVSGIQTNWWRVGSLSESQINFLKNSGWIYVPDGTAWGLESGAYFAQNVANTCGGGSNNNNNGGGGGGGDPSAPACTASKPPTPVMLNIQRNGSSATLAWTPVNPVSYYTIGYGLQPGNYQYGVPNTGNVTSYTINNLDPNALYYFAVRAVNECDPGDWATISYGGFGGEVLGLASTGDALQRLLVVLGGLGLLFVGLRVSSSKK